MTINNSSSSDIIQDASQTLINSSVSFEKDTSNPIFLLPKGLSTLRILLWARHAGHTPTNKSLQVARLTTSTKTGTLDNSTVKSLVKITSKVQLREEIIPNSVEVGLPAKRRLIQLMEPSVRVQENTKIFQTQNSNYYSLIFCRFCGKWMRFENSLDSHTRRCLFKPVRQQLWSILDKGASTEPSEWEATFGRQIDFDNKFEESNQAIFSHTSKYELKAAIEQEISERQSWMDKAEKFPLLVEDPVRMSDYNLWLETIFFKEDWQSRIFRNNCHTAKGIYFQLDPNWLTQQLYKRASSDVKKKVLPLEEVAFSMIQLSTDLFLQDLLSMSVYFSRLFNSSSATLVASQGILSESMLHSGKYLKCVTPLHLFKAIHQRPNFSFLRNKSTT